LTIHPCHSAAKMVIEDLPLGQRLSTQFIDNPVRLLTVTLELQY
jgi:hypothetical protein